jgi:hypothetical protein
VYVLIKWLPFVLNVINALGSLIDLLSKARAVRITLTLSTVTTRKSATLQESAMWQLRALRRRSADLRAAGKLPLEGLREQKESRFPSSERLLGPFRFSLIQLPSSAKSTELFSSVPLPASIAQSFLSSFALESKRTCRQIRELRPAYRTTCIYRKEGF